VVPWRAYLKLPGRPLLDLRRPLRLAHGTSIAATLGGLLTTLHAVPVDRMAQLVDPDDPPLVEWRREAAQIYGTVAGKVPENHRGGVAVPGLAATVSVNQHPGSRRRPGQAGPRHTLILAGRGPAGRTRSGSG
jgi:hypothetical protein